jgi:hypothetical protein
MNNLSICEGFRPLFLKSYKKIRGHIYEHFRSQIQTYLYEVIFWGTLRNIVQGINLDWSPILAVAKSEHF